MDRTISAKPECARTTVAMTGGCPVSDGADYETLSRTLTAVGASNLERLVTLGLIQPGRTIDELVAHLHSFCGGKFGVSLIEQVMALDIIAATAPRFANDAFCRWLSDLKTISGPGKPFGLGGRQWVERLPDGLSMESNFIFGDCVNLREPPNRLSVKANPDRHELGTLFHE
jgi:hypothetical protein